MKSDKSERESEELLGETRLESWKQIAAYLQRNAVTVRRWEKEEGLPVHRHAHKSRSSVYAYPREIDAWRAGRKVAAEPGPAIRPWWRPLAVGVTTMLCLIMVGNGVRPQVVSAESGLRARQVWIPAGQIDPSVSIPSPDGRYIGFTDWATGDVGVRDLTAGIDRRLTDTGGWEKSGSYGEGTAISQDGKWVAYAWSDTKEGDGLRIAPVGGGPPQTIFRNEYMVPAGWTPDGKQIAVASIRPGQTWQIAMLSIADKSLRAVKSLGWARPDARLSPDGRYIAYAIPVSGQNNARDIFVLATDGSREAAVVRNPADDFGAIWSPDGSRLLFLSDRTGNVSLWSIAMEAGKPKGEAALVKRDLGRVIPLGLSRSGTYNYFVPGGGPDIYSAELGPDGKISKAPVLAVDKLINSNLGPAISPDGKRLAYVQIRGGGGAGEAALMIRTVETGEDHEVPLRRVPISRSFGYGPMWFPEGRSLLIGTNADPGHPGFGFVRVDLETAKTELLHRAAHGIQGYALSPDGRSIYYTEIDTSVDSATNPRTRLMRFDLESRRETELKSGEWFIAVAVSPDNKQLAYVVQASPGPGARVEVMPVSGGEPRAVYRAPSWVSGSRYNTLSWTPDQKWLQFVRDPILHGPSKLWRIPVEGGQPEEVGLSLQGNVKSPQMQSDGRRLYYAVFLGGKGEMWALENFLPEAAPAR